MNNYELECIFDSKKSFYGKANIREEEGKKILISYSTEVCFIENDIPFIKGFYSNTTLRHIKEFLSQNGFKAISKKQMEKDYKNE